MMHGRHSRCTAGWCLRPNEHARGRGRARNLVVVTETSWRASLGRIGRIGIGGRYLLLLVDGFLDRILLSHFLQILPHRVMHLCRFRLGDSD